MKIPAPDEWAKQQGYRPFPARWSRWLNDVRDAVMSAQGIAGRFVSISEHPSKGTVYNAADTSERRGPIPPTNDCPCLQVVFSGVTFDCGCIDVSGGGSMESTKFTDDHFNGVDPVPLSVDPGLCCTDDCFNPCTMWTSTDTTITPATYTVQNWFSVADCSGDPDSTASFGPSIYLMQDSGTWYLLAYQGRLGGGIFPIFSGSTADITSPISNDLSCGSTTIDNPLIECRFGHSETGSVVAHSGSAAITAATHCGACCAFGDCFQMTPESCTNLGGTYQGDGTLCHTTTC